VKSKELTFKKRWRVNPARLVANLFILFCLVLLFLIFMNFTAGQTRGLGEDEFFEIIVEQGDSLWSIACEFYPNQDPRYTVSVIRDLNGLQNNPTVIPGQILNIPKY